MIGIQRGKHEFWRFGLYVVHIATVLERKILFEDHIREGADVYLICISKNRIGQR